MLNPVYGALDKNLAIANKSCVSRAHHTRTAFYSINISTRPKTSSKPISLSRTTT